MVCIEVNQAADQARFEIRPNCSASWHANVLLIMGLGSLMALISVSFAVQGYWVVLPFAGAEIAALAVCLYLCLRQQQRCEVILVDREFVSVERKTDGPRAYQRVRRAWAQARFVPSAKTSDVGRLLISAHGRVIEVAACLVDSEKRQLADELRAFLDRPLLSR